MLYVDFHVHLRSSVSPSEFIRAARANIRQLGGRHATGVLCFADSPGDLGFQQLLKCVRADGLNRTCDLHVAEEDDQGNAISLVLTFDSGSPLICVAGHQLVTKENIEVLALGVAWRPAEKLPLSDLIPCIRGLRGLPVIPWSLGKWWGRRGQRVRAEVEKATPGELYLGDSAHRVVEYPFTDMFDTAETKGLVILPGSDPFPIAGEVRRVGSFGGRLDIVLDHEQPFAQLSNLLISAENHEIPSFGYRLRFSSAIALQTRLVLQRYRTHD